MKRFTVILTIIAVITYFSACNPNQQGAPNNTTNQQQVQKTETGTDLDGIGKYKNIQLAEALDQTKATKGEGVYDLKCSACHKLDDKRVVGPGWQGVLSRRTPAWVMNFITNTDEMLDKDKAAQGMLEICLVRMPNQSVSEEDAYALVEFMRKNDGVK